MMAGNGVKERLDHTYLARVVTTCTRTACASGAALAPPAGTRTITRVRGRGSLRVRLALDRPNDELRAERERRPQGVLAQTSLPVCLQVVDGELVLLEYKNALNPPEATRAAKGGT